MWDWIQGIGMSLLAVFGIGNAEVKQMAPVVAEAEQVLEDPTGFVEEQLPIELPVSGNGEEAEAASETSEPVEEVPALAEDDVAMMLGEQPTGTELPAATPAVAGPDIRTMLVAGGCFWCVEADLEKTSGVISAVSGYAGGSTENPTYKNYGSGGHREVVEVTFDANEVSFEEILIVTMKTTDPTDDDGTFADRGDKYSAAFYYENPAELAIINNLIAEVNELGPYDAPLAVDVEARPQFWQAEDSHQDYYKGTLTRLKYQYYRNASGRNDFIETHWGGDTSPTLPWRADNNETISMNTYPWSNYQKPDLATLEATLEPLAFKVTQKDGTERAGTSPLDKIYEPGIYVDILSGEPLFSSKDKFDSGTGWPSFTQPITTGAVTEHEDRKLFVTRTEIRSAIADNHLGHVFTDGPADRGGLRYCMNGVALRFVPEAAMQAEGYGDFVEFI
jgi:peptide methionine sulfoxide reductase msrA/msrB